MFLNLQNPVVREWPASPAATSHRRIVASSHRRIVASSHRRISERGDFFEFCKAVLPLPQLFLLGQKERMGKRRLDSTESFFVIQTSSGCRGARALRQAVAGCPVPRRAHRAGGDVGKTMAEVVSASGVFGGIANAAQIPETQTALPELPINAPKSATNLPARIANVPEPITILPKFIKEVPEPITDVLFE